MVEIIKIGLILTLMCGLFYTAGDVFIKQWLVKGSWLFYWLAAFMYFIAMNFLAFSFKSKSIAVASALAVISNIILLIVISYFGYKEPITIRQLIGLALSILAIFLLG